MLFIQGHLNYFHSIVAKLCTTEHYSCQKLEARLGGDLKKKKKC